MPTDREPTDQRPAPRKVTDEEFREIIGSGFGRPTSWGKAVCDNIGCGVLVGCFRPDCPAMADEASNGQ